jgi:hypothetical protein
VKNKKMMNNLLVPRIQKKGPLLSEKARAHMSGTHSALFIDFEIVEMFINNKYGGWETGW